MKTALALPLLDSILGIFLIGLIGFVLQRRGLFGERGRETLSATILYVAFPAISFHAMVTKVDPDALGRGALTALYGLLIPLAGLGAGYLFALPTRLQGPTRATFVHCLSANNFINLPLPIILVLWPEQTGTLFLMLLGAGTAFWTVSLYPLVRGQHPWDQAKNVINVPFLALLAGLAIALAGGREAMETQPVLKTILRTSQLLGQAMAPLALLFVGATLAGARSGTRRRVMAWYSLCRLVLFPLLFLPLVALSGLPRPAQYVVLLVAMMPASNTSAMVADRFGGDERFASAANLYSTPLALATVPVLFPIFAAWLG